MFKYFYNRTPTPEKNIDIIFCFLFSFHLFNPQFCRYAIGDRLSPDHQRTILQRLLPYHPECDKKIGPGVDYITVCHPPPASFTDLLHCYLTSHLSLFTWFDLSISPCTNASSWQKDWITSLHALESWN